MSTLIPSAGTSTFKTGSSTLSFIEASSLIKLSAFIVTVTLFIDLLSTVLSSAIPPKAYPLGTTCSPLCANTGPVLVITPPCAYPLRDKLFVLNCSSCHLRRASGFSPLSSSLIESGYLLIISSLLCTTLPILTITFSFSSALNDSIIVFIVASTSFSVLNEAIIFFIDASTSVGGLIILLVNAVVAALSPSTPSKKAFASSSVFFPVKTPRLRLLYLSLYSCVKEGYNSFPPAALSISNLDSYPFFSSSDTVPDSSLRLYSFAKLGSIVLYSRAFL